MCDIKRQSYFGINITFVLEENNRGWGGNSVTPVKFKKTLYMSNVWTETVASISTSSNCDMKSYKTFQLEVNGRVICMQYMSHLY